MVMHYKSEIASSSDNYERTAVYFTCEKPCYFLSEVQYLYHFYCLKHISTLKYSYNNNVNVNFHKIQHFNECINDEIFRTYVIATHLLGMSGI